MTIGSCRCAHTQAHMHEQILVFWHININNSTRIGTPHLWFWKLTWPQIWCSMRISELISILAGEPVLQLGFKGGLLAKACLSSAQCSLLSFFAAGWVIQTLPTPSPTLPESSKVQIKGRHKHSLSLQSSVPMVSPLRAVDKVLSCLPNTQMPCRRSGF